MTEAPVCKTAPTTPTTWNSHPAFVHSHPGPGLAMHGQETPEEMTACDFQNQVFKGTKVSARVLWNTHSRKRPPPCCEEEKTSHAEGLTSQPSEGATVEAAPTAPVKSPDNRRPAQHLTAPAETTRARTGQLSPSRSLTLATRGEDVSPRFQAATRCGWLVTKPQARQHVHFGLVEKSA